MCATTTKQHAAEILQVAILTEVQGREACHDSTVAGPGHKHIREACRDSSWAWP